MNLLIHTDLVSMSMMIKMVLEASVPCSELYVRISLVAPSSMTPTATRLTKDTGCAASQNDVKWLRPGWSGLTSSKLSHSTHSSHLRWQWCWSWSRCKWWQFEKLFLLLVSFLGGLCWTTCFWAILQLNRKDLFSVHYQMIFVFNQFHICKVQRNENCRCKFALLIFSTRNEYQEIWAAGYFALSPAQYFSCRMMSRTRLQFDSAFLQSA